MNWFLYFPTDHHWQQWLLRVQLQELPAEKETQAFVSVINTHVRTALIFSLSLSPSALYIISHPIFSARHILDLYFWDDAASQGQE